MRVVVGRFVVAESAQGFDYCVLGFGLASVDDVVDFRDVAEVRMNLFAVNRGYPALVLIGIAVELAISKIAPEQSELSHVICDIFADIADSTIGADNYFLIFLGNRGWFGFRIRSVGLLTLGSDSGL
jgi:hypothetical protein